MDLLNKAQLSAVPAQLSICAPLTSGAEVRGAVGCREMFSLEKAPVAVPRG